MAVSMGVLSVNANGDFIYMPELLRVKGHVLGSMPEPNIEEAEACFTQSAASKAHAHGSCAPQSTWPDCGPIAANRSTVEHCCSRSSINVEGQDTADPLTAARLLAELGRINRSGGRPRR
jgi:hypothetical protein